MSIKYLAVILPRTQAVIAFDLESKKVSAIYCSNSFCNQFKDKICPQYCQVIVEAKKYVFGRRRPKAEVYEIEEEEALKIVED
jgi:hypothetical protein